MPTRVPPLRMPLAGRVHRVIEAALRTLSFYVVPLAIALFSLGVAIWTMLTR